LLQELRAKGVRVTLLDADEIRKLEDNREFSDEGRYKNLSSLARRASEAEQRGDMVIIAAMAPKREWREMMRSMWQSSRIIYLPGGILWPGTSYEPPADGEYHVYPRR